MAGLIRFVVTCTLIYYAVYKDSKLALTVLFVLLYLTNELVSMMLRQIKKYHERESGIDIFK